MDTGGRLRKPSRETECFKTSARYHNYNLIAAIAAKNKIAVRQKPRRFLIVANEKYKQRRWAVPSKRAKNYAAERKLKVHNRGPKEGKPLSDFEAGIRSGYLQCQTDHSGIWKYKKQKESEKAAKEARK